MRDHIFVDPTNDHEMALKNCSASLRGGADDKSCVGKIENSAISLKCEKAGTMANVRKGPSRAMNINEKTQ